MTAPSELGSPVHAVWYRADLRVTDHRPLLDAAARASREGGAVHCVYCLDPSALVLSEHLGLPRMGPFRGRFLVESLEALRASLRSLGSELIVRLGDPAEQLVELAKTWGWATLGFHELPGTEEARLERRVRSGLEGVGTQVIAHWDRTLHDEYPFEIHETPEVFSSFRKRVERDGAVAEPLAAPARLPGPGALEAGALPTLEDVGAEGVEVDGRAVMTFRGGEAAGFQRLRAFVTSGAIRTYKETRNGLIGADYSSKLSPWLALGCVSTRMVQAEVARHEEEHGANDSTYWVSFELLWRDYFQLILKKHGSAVFQPSGLQRVNVPWRRDAGQFEAWRLGRTGYPFIDGHMRELLHTGYMSNRGRQNVGSFLTKNLGLDWRLGAEWFEVQLVDFDVASNYGNWNYTAGVGNDARGFRYFNIPKQASMYDPDGEHAKLWVDELGTPEYTGPIVELEASQRVQRKAWERAMRAGG